MFKYPSVIIIHGQSATGKSSIAKRLADDLNIPVFHKDAIKEDLFDHLGYRKRRLSGKFDEATRAILLTMMESFLHGGNPCIIEGNLDADRVHIQRFMEKFEFKVVEIFCHSSSEKIIQRFTERAQSGERHPGHSDKALLAKIRKQILSHPPIEPLNLGGKVLKIDTTDLAALDYDHLLHEVKFWTNVAFRLPHRIIGAAFGVIFNDNEEVLLCHRTDKDLWNLPGGAMEEHEAPWESAIREVKEETGLDVELKHFTGMYFRPKVNEEEHDQLTYVFLCQPIGGELTLNEEADQIQYFPISQLPKNLSPRHAERIMDAFSNTPETFYKTLL